MSDILRYDHQAISNRLRELRKTHKLSQEDIAQRLYVHRTTVIKWENHEKDELPSLADMLKLCNIFDCDLSYLLCEQECTTKDIQGIAKYTGLSEGAIAELHRLAKSDAVSAVKARDELIGQHTLDGLSYYSAKIKLETAELAKYIIEKAPEHPSDFDSFKIACKFQILQIMEAKGKALSLLESFIADYTNINEVTEKAEDIFAKMEKIQELIAKKDSVRIGE